MAEESTEFLFGKITKGKDYRISFQDDASFDIFTLQYGFKPVNIDSKKAGSLLVESNEATVELTKNDDAHEVFKGKVEDESEYLLVFEDDMFKVCKVSKSVNNLKPIRGNIKPSPSKVPRKNVASEIKIRAANAKKRKLAEAVPSSAAEPDLQPTGDSSVPTGDINSLDDLFS